VISPGVARATLGAVVGAFMVTTGALLGMPSPERTRPLDRLDEGPIGAQLPPGWELRPVRGFDAPESVVTDDTGSEHIRRAIRFEATGRAGFFWLELDEPVDPGLERLRWSWRVDEAVLDAHLRRPERDDAPARFFVVFGRRGIFSSPRILFYSWGGSDQIGEHWVYPGDKNVRVKVLRNDSSPTRTWLLETRDLIRDHVEAFGTTPDLVTAVGFVIDTDQTGSSASSMLGPIEALRKPAGRHR